MPAAETPRLRSITLTGLVFDFASERSELAKAPHALRKLQLQSHEGNNLQGRHFDLDILPQFGNRHSLLCIHRASDHEFMICSRPLLGDGHVYSGFGQGRLDRVVQAPTGRLA